MPSIQFDDFIHFAKSLDGQVIPTRAGRATFRVEVTDKGMIFTPKSGKPRLHQNAYLRRVLDQHAKTGSLKNPQYKHITFCASYVLTLIDRYLNAKSK